MNKGTKYKSTQEEESLSCAIKENLLENISVHALLASNTNKTSSWGANLKIQTLH